MYNNGNPTINKSTYRINGIYKKRPSPNSLLNFLQLAAKCSRGKLAICCFNLLLLPPNVTPEIMGKGGQVEDTPFKAYPNMLPTFYHADKPTFTT